MFLIVLCLGTIVASEVYYNIRPSHGQTHSCGDQCSNAACDENDLTLSQFIDNSSDYLTNDSRLIFSPGNYRLESEFIVENVHSFSMMLLIYSVWPITSSKAVIVCSHNARFEFRNISSVSVIGLEFSGCFETYVLSVGHFHLESSAFYGHGQTISNGTVMTIKDSVANLTRVVFLSAIEKLHNSTVHQGVSESSTAAISSSNRVIGILLERSIIEITQSLFERNNVGIGGFVIHDQYGSKITIISTTFVHNTASCLSECNITGGIVYAISKGSIVQINESKFVRNVGVVIFRMNGSIFITHTKLINNECTGRFATIYITNASLAISQSIFTNNNGSILKAKHTNVSIRYSEFNGNIGFFTMCMLSGMIINIDYSKFVNNNGFQTLGVVNTSMVSVTHSEFVENTATNWLVFLDGVMITVYLNEFISNRGGFAIVETQYYTTSENITNNVFIDNRAQYEIYIDPTCRQGYSLSLGSSSSCIKCSENWHQDLIGIVIAAFIAGIALVIFMLVLNMTVAVGTLNGILFYVNVVAANADAYFFSLTTPNFITIFISWLNLDIGFDVCFYVENEDNLNVFDLDQLYKILLQLTFSAYLIILVIIIIVVSECSSKFATLIGKGNPVAVLATMILLSYAKLLKVVRTSLFLSYWQPAFGSRNIDVTRLINAVTFIETISNTEIKAESYALLTIIVLVFVLCLMYTILLFSWQWLLQYQDKAIFKWVRYQKLRHFLEPYHAPYIGKYRYWMGLLLFVRMLLYLISVVNFSLDPRVHLMSVIFVISGLIFLKGVIAKRVYKNWPLDVIETTIYFNLAAFSALTWFNLDFRGNQVAVAYTSVMITFGLLLGVIVFHILCYTRLYRSSFVKKAFEWASSKLLKNQSTQGSLKDAPEEMDGYQLERHAAGDQELPTITHTVVEICQPCQSKD